MELKRLAGSCVRLDLFATGARLATAEIQALLQRYPLTRCAHTGIR